MSSKPEVRCDRCGDICTDGGGSYTSKNYNYQDVCAHCRRRLKISDAESNKTDRRAHDNASKPADEAWEREKRKIFRQ